MIPRDQTSADEKDRTRRLQRTASGLLYAVLVAVAIWMIRDFIPAVVWAAVIAIALWPLLTWLEQQPVFKERRTWLAVMLTVVLGLVFVVPFILVAAQAGTEARDLFRWFHESLRTGIPMPDLVNHLPAGSTQISAWWQEILLRRWVHRRRRNTFIARPWSP